MFTIGDSTVRNGDGSGRNGQWGWGAFLGQYLDSTYCVENRALGGRSSRTYISEGLWANTLSRVQTGDYVLMQFGHNDGGEPHRGRARATLKGNGDESKEYVMEQSGDTVAIHSYGWYMRQYIRDTKAKGAIPVVVSLIPRNRWSNGKVERSTDTYAGWAKQAAEAEGALFIDLNALVSDKYDVLGKSFVDNLYYGDHTHTSLTGAQLNASIVAEELLKLVE
ncbi:MAG: rhamnogalacturonan acetylesterase [Bacteroidales bacterium]|nr:rhamnogalacturonan acetylesterase [Bacteroidales bacterium]